MLEVEYAQELPSLFHTDQFSGQPQPPNYNFYLIWGLLLIFIVNNRYYDDQKSINVIITESDGLEMTMSEK